MPSLSSPSCVRCHALSALHDLRPSPVWGCPPKCGARWKRRGPEVESAAWIGRDARRIWIRPRCARPAPPVARTFPSTEMFSGLDQNDLISICAVSPDRHERPGEQCSDIPPRGRPTDTIQPWHPSRPPLGRVREIRRQVARPHEALGPAGPSRVDRRSRRLFDADADSGASHRFRQHGRDRFRADYAEIRIRTRTCLLE